MSYFLEYKEKIDSEEIIACKKIKSLLKRYNKFFISDKEFAIFDKNKSDKVIEFIETFCRHSIGEKAGQPFLLELWQKAIIELIFGVVDQETRLRICNQVLNVIGRKNGKSLFASAISLYMLLMDGEDAPHIYCCAPKFQQAEIVFKESIKMIKQDYNLINNLKTLSNRIETVDDTFGVMEPLAGDAITLDGLNPHLISMDEIHAMKTRDLYDVMISSFGARKQPLLLMITTAGIIRDSIYDDLYAKSELILNGTSEDYSFLPIIFELDNIEEFNDINMSIKANPNLGVSKSVEYIEQQIAHAEISPKEKVNFLTKHCNIRQTGSEKWLEFNDVVNCQVEKLDDELLYDTYAVGGVDLSKTTDLTSASILVRKGTKTYCYSMSWLPEKKIKESLSSLSNQDKIPYALWQERGFVRSSGINNVDYNDVVAWFQEMEEKLELTIFSVGFDNWNANEFSTNMHNAGFKMEKVIQGARSLSEPMKKLEIDILNGDFVYDNECLKMGLLNMSIAMDVNENIRPVKESAIKRIDPAVATITAYARLQEHKQDFDYVLDEEEEE